MVKNKIMNIFLVVCLLFVTTNCASTKRMVPSGDLCGLIIDENNKPVENFLVTCTNNGIFRETVITNNSGIFVFQDVKTDTYYLTCEMENYSIVKNKEYIFNDNLSMFCIQIFSIDKVLREVDSYIRIGEFQKGVNLLNNVQVKKDNNSKAVVLAYKAYLYSMLQDWKNYTECIRESKKLKINKLNEFIEKLEKKNEV